MQRPDVYIEVRTGKQRVFAIMNQGTVLEEVEKIPVPLVNLFLRVKAYAQEHQLSYGSMAWAALDYPEQVDGFELVDNYAFFSEGEHTQSFAYNGELGVIVMERVEDAYNLRYLPSKGRAEWTVRCKSEKEARETLFERIRLMRLRALV